jgi:hypothetical protein
MTCIVSIADGKKVWMGADGCGSNHSFKLEVIHPKVFIREIDGPKKKEKIIIGGCGSFRMLQLLEYSLKLPKIKRTQTVVNWLVTDFADACRKLFTEKGLAFIANNSVQIDVNGSSFLVGFRGQLYHVYSDFQAFAATTSEAAAGSGTMLALGSLHTSNALKDWILNEVPVSPEARIELALQAASDINPFVSPPFTILSI